MNEELNQQIEFFWKGNLTIEEQKDLLSKLQHDNEALFNELKKEFDERILNSEQNFSEEFYQDILQNIHKKSLVKDQPRKLKKLVFYKWLAAASVFVFCAISCVVILQQLNSRHVSNAVLVQNDSTILINKKDKIQIATLPDQSVVEMSPNSQIAFGPYFGKSDRNIDMQGVVKFKVAHNQQLPFVVISQGYTTTALGTTFIVESYPNKKISIKLLEGKVVVNNQTLQKNFKKAIYLLPGEKVDIQDGEVQVISVKKQVEKPKIISKTNNVKPFPLDDKIIFNDLSLEQVFSELQKLKGVNIEFNKTNSTANTFTGEFSKDESIEEILNIICRMNKLSFEHKHGIIFIEKQNTGEINN